MNKHHKYKKKNLLMDNKIIELLIYIRPLCLLPLKLWLKNT